MFLYLIKNIYVPSKRSVSGVDFISFKFNDIMELKLTFKLSIFDMFETLVAAVLALETKN